MVTIEDIDSFTRKNIYELMSNGFISLMKLSSDVPNKTFEISLPRLNELENAVAHHPISFVRTIYLKSIFVPARMKQPFVFIFPNTMYVTSSVNALEELNFRDIFPDLQSFLLESIIRGALIEVR